MLIFRKENNNQNYSVLILKDIDASVECVSRKIIQQNTYLYSCVSFNLLLQSSQWRFQTEIDVRKIIRDIIKVTGKMLKRVFNVKASDLSQEEIYQ